MVSIFPACICIIKKMLKAKICMAFLIYVRYYSHSKPSGHD
uniref:Uncharacterized protein n=1 Tax=Arundo donax TaxID=35708 RepID=A0A0A9GPM4_ARUDO